MTRAWCPGSHQTPSLNAQDVRECPVCGWVRKSGFDREDRVTMHVQRAPRDKRSASEWLVDTFIEICNEYEREVAIERAAGGQP